MMQENVNNNNMTLLVASFLVFFNLSGSFLRFSDFFDRNIYSFTRWLLISKHAPWESFISIWNLQMEIIVYQIYLK